MSQIKPLSVALALGANIGDRLSNLKAAVKALEAYVEVTKRSSVYESSAAYVHDQPSFLNAVILGTTQIEPLPLLWMIKDIESEIGRTPTFRYGPRVIDIDLLFYENAVIDTPELILPHPRLQERPFVLEPLRELVPEWVHPQTHLSVSQLASACTLGDIVRVEGKL